MPVHWGAFCSALETRMAHTAPGRGGAQFIPSYWGEMEPAAAELGRRAAVWGQTSLFSTKPVLPHVFFMKNPLVMWSCRVPVPAGSRGSIFSDSNYRQHDVTGTSLPLVSSSCKQGTAWWAKLKASRLLGCCCHHCQHLAELFRYLAC